MAGYFDTSRINVVNRALDGLSSRTYLTLGYWDSLLAMLKPGDVVIMQVGHNDSGPVNDNYRARGSIKGTGEESMEIDNIILKKHEVVYSYGWYLRKFIADAKGKGATPIICSLVPRKIWQEGKVATNSQDYVKWAAEVADHARVGFVNLNAIIARKYEELGPERVEPSICRPADTYHTGWCGDKCSVSCRRPESAGLKIPCLLKDGEIPLPVCPTVAHGTEYKTLGNLRWLQLRKTEEHFRRRSFATERSEVRDPLAPTIYNLSVRPCTTSSSPHHPIPPSNLSPEAKQPVFLEKTARNRDFVETLVLECDIRMLGKLFN